jgi:Holliday junction resolvase RusA-like endonuclease
MLSGASPHRVASFTVPGEPRSKQRPRVTRYGTYTPKETLRRETEVRFEWLALNQPRFEYQVIIDITFYNATKHRRDIDNMAKLVLDALNTYAFRDDFHVVGLNLKKKFTSKGKARTEITLREVITWPYES